MYLFRALARMTRVCLIWLGQEAPTQELSETDIIRGAKLEDGILRVVFPLMDGVFSPCAKDTSAPRFGSPSYWLIHKCDICCRAGACIP